MSLIGRIDEVVKLVKDGVLEKDWKLIVDSYEILTGVTMDIPEEEEDPIKQMMRRLEQLEKDRAVVKETLKTKPTKVNKAKTSKEKNVESSKTNGRQNKFEEMMGEISREVANENGFDKINDKVNPTPRTRKAYTPATLTCTRCKKTEQVNPMFKKDDYRCNNCIGK